MAKTLDHPAVAGALLERKAGMKENVEKVVKVLRSRMIVQLDSGRFVICATSGEARGDVASGLYRKPTDDEIVAKVAEIARGICAQCPS